MDLNYFHINKHMGRVLINKYPISSYKAAGIIILRSLQVRVLLESTTFLLHKIFTIAGIIIVAGIA